MDDGAIELSTSSVNVPISYAGVEALKTITPIGFNYGLTRSWDYIGISGYSSLFIKNINPSNGVFDWVTFDLFFSNNIGKDFIFTLGQPADWMILRAANGGANYGGKANMCPTGITEINNYLAAVTAVVNRAKNTYGVTGIKWELWNEIEGKGNYNDTLSSLGPYAKAVYTTIKSIDPTAIVLSPSARDDDTAFMVGDFMGYSDGSAGLAGDSVDAIAWHFYGQDDAWTYKRTVDVYKQQLARFGYSSKPMYITESGSLVPTSNWGTKIKRRMLCFAALGCKSWVGYASDFTTIPMADYKNDFNYISQLISGSTITSLIKNKDETVTAIVNGVPVTV